MAEMNKALMDTGETNMQLIARSLKWYAKLAEKNFPETAKEMLWLSDLATGEHAHVVELHRLYAHEQQRRESLQEQLKECEH